MTIDEFDNKFKEGDKISQAVLLDNLVYEITDIKIGEHYFKAKHPYLNGFLTMREKTYNWKLVPKPSGKEKEDWSEGNKKIRRDLYAKMLSEFTKHPMDGYKIKLDESVQKQIDFEKTFSEYKKGISGEKEIKRLRAELAERDRVINDLCSLCQTYLRTRQRVN